MQQDHHKYGWVTSEYSIQYNCMFNFMMSLTHKYYLDDKKVENSK